MKLKKIILKNIRSYENFELEFPEGSTLLSGDIGAGKTTILLAIEFALFGLQPGQRGFALLRNGETEGSVKIEFQIEEKNILIERSLKKTKTVSQDFCSIEIDGVREEISVTELKTRILEILNYPKEFTKKQNLLYRFTVYTPQEEMKQIILQDPETRINTLRHVFGIDKYKKILENVSVVASKIREEKRFKEAVTSNLENEKENLVLKKENFEKKVLDLQEIEKELLLKKNLLEGIQKEKDEIFKKIEEKRELQKEIEKTNLMISAKKESVLENKKNIFQLEAQIDELRKLSFDENEILNLENEILEFKNNKKDLNEKNLNLMSEISSLNLKNSENENLKNNLPKLDTCPTCLQDVDPNYKANVQNKLENEISENVKKISEKNLEKEKISAEISVFENKILESEKKIQDLRILKIKLQGISDKEKNLGGLLESQEKMEKDVVLLEQHNEVLKKSVFDLEKFENIFEDKNKKLNEALEEERSVEIKAAELKKEIHLFEIQIKEISEKIEKTEEIKKELGYLTELENWLSKKFIPVISFIEKNVMVKLKIEFSQVFSEWFSMLVSENFNVSLREDFTPVIEQQDYEIDYAYLSGGERTAIALAYRLALNQVINSFLGKIKTKDFVILDEPTDGFSDEQLDKMRDVLQELETEQLIIVSHEQKIESFVENVIRLKKEKGLSEIDVGDVAQMKL